MYRRFALPHTYASAASRTAIDACGAAGIDRFELPPILKYVYVGGYSIANPAFCVINVENKTAPALEGYTAGAGRCAFIATMDKDKACSTSPPADRLYVLDTSDKANPTVLSSITSTELDDPMQVCFLGNYAYVVAYVAHALVIVDLSDPTTPIQVGYVIDTVNLAYPLGVDVLGNYAYVTSSTGDRLTVVDVSDPTLPSVVGTTGADPRLDLPRGVRVVGNYAYVTAQDAIRLTVVDISDPTAPSIVASLYHDYFNNPRYLDVSGNYAYIPAAVVDRLTIVDISNPTAPAVVGSVYAPVDLDWTTYVRVYGDFAFASSFYRDRLTIVDVGSKDAPQVIGSVTHVKLTEAVGVAVVPP